MRYIRSITLQRQPNGTWDNASRRIFLIDKDINLNTVSISFNRSYNSLVDADHVIISDDENDEVVDLSKNEEIPCTG